MIAKSNFRADDDTASSSSPARSPPPASSSAPSRRRVSEAAMPSSSSLSSVAPTTTTTTTTTALAIVAAAAAAALPIASASAAGASAFCCSSSRDQLSGRGGPFAVPRRRGGGRTGPGSSASSAAPAIFAGGPAPILDFGRPRPPRLSSSSSLFASFESEEVMESEETDENDTGRGENDEERDVEIVLPRHSPLNDPPGASSSTYPSVLHSVHVVPLLASEEASRLLKLARKYASESGCWNAGPDDDRHASYATVDFPVEDAEEMESYLDEINFHERALGHMTERYGVAYEDMEYLDFFCANYEAPGSSKGEEDENEEEEDRRVTMDRLAPHRDGSLLSYTVLLTPPSEFEGGGTLFDALRDVDPSDVEEAGPGRGRPLAPGGVVRPTRAGSAVLHAGKALHGADVVTSGTRTVLVGFVDVADRCVRYGTLGDACKEWGRVDVMAKRLGRQEKRTAAEKGKEAQAERAKGWVLRNGKFFDSEGGSCYANGHAPAFSSVRKRGDPEYMRRKKLEAEDLLLRDILLPEEERDDAALFGGDVTVL